MKWALLVAESLFSVFLGNTFPLLPAILLSIVTSVVVLEIVHRMRDNDT